MTAAQSYDTFVLAFTDPAINSAAPQRARVDANSSFELFDDSHVRTLSSNDGGGDIEGLLYVPDLLPSDSCTNASARYIPSNVTRLSDLPATQYLYVAIAPWISAPCTLSYLAAANGVTAFMFYHPDNGSDTPPPVSDPSWDLGDGGRWKSQNKFPVYAIPGLEGAIIIQELAQYNGNSSNPLIRGILDYEQFDQSDYVRLYTSFGTDGSSDLPSLWAFLLIVLGIVLLLIGTTSFSMHFFQRRYRRALQRRVENGEVDLETLGIKRSTPVPQEEIDKLPTYIYTPSSDAPKERTTDMPNPSSPTSAAPLPRETFYSQFSCTICLEDFIPNETKVRSLPCHHIYHPQCIDPHLSSRSSRCPVCMAQVLARKDVPITNAMVRAERRIRERQRRETGGNPDGWSTLNLRRQLESGRRVFSAPVSHIFTGTNNERTRSQIEMDVVGGGGRAVSSPMPNSATVEMSGAQGADPTPPPADANLRSEWVRRRLSRLRPERTLEDEEAERWARMPSCKCLFASYYGVSALLLTKVLCIRAESNRYSIPWLSMNLYTRMMLCTAFFRLGRVSKRFDLHKQRGVGVG